MAVSEEFQTFIIDQLQSLGAVTIRRMFGGAGVYHDGLMFALIAGDTLYLKADDASQAEFEVEGMGPFVYGAGGKRVVMSYWQAPDRLFDDPDELCAWARRACDAAARSRGETGSRLKPRGRRRGSSARSHRTPT